jgi:hypothetical protein
MAGDAYHTNVFKDAENIPLSLNSIWAEIISHLENADNPDVEALLQGAESGADGT